MKLNQLYFLFLGLTSYNLLHSQIQNQTVNWRYLINQSGLTFSTEPPSTLTALSFVSGMYGAGKGTSLSDLSGNLLFYTKGLDVRNAQYNIMANGTGLGGGTSGIATGDANGMGIKQPGSNFNYYVFTNDIFGNTINNTSTTDGGLRYSIIDMSLAAGTGSVTLKNAPILTPAGSNIEMLAATRHCNANDVWILAHQNNSTNFLAYLLTAAGINTVPIISSAGPVYNYTPGVSDESITNTLGASIKVSPWGNKIACLSPHDELNNIVKIYLYDFDNTAGTLSNPLILTPQGNYKVYSFEFSSDGGKLYAAVANYSLSSNGQAFPFVLQWNLCAGSASAIIASVDTVFVSQNSLSVGDMQLAPNGKIYIPISTTGFGNTIPNNFHVIESPNVQGSACNYNNTSLYPGYAFNALPIFDAYLLRPNFTYTPQTNCARVLFTKPLPSSCNPNYVPVSYLWNFGDPASGLANTSTLTSPSHDFSNSGNYTVKVTVTYNSCAADTFIRVVTPISSPAAPNLSVSPNNTVLCQNSTLALIASGASSYTWSTGAQTPSIIVSPASLTQYYVTGADANGCLAMSQVITINVLPTPTLSINASNSFTLCSPQQQTLSVSGAYSYLWQWGTSSWATTSFLIVNPAVTTQYSITGTDTNGCSSSKVLTLTIGCTGIAEMVKKKDDFKIYPNPVNEILNIEFIDLNQIENFRIYNSFGEIILNEKLNFTKGIAHINLNSLPKGMYFIQIEATLGKFLKE